MTVDDGVGASHHLPTCLDVFENNEKIFNLWLTAEIESMLKKVTTSTTGGTCMHVQTCTHNMRVQTCTTLLHTTHVTQHRTDTNIIRNSCSTKLLLIFGVGNCVAGIPRRVI